jgi:hypothetical protein
VNIRPIGEKSSPNLVTLPMRQQECHFHEQGCQMEYFQTKNSNLGKFWRALEWKMLEYLWPFGIFIAIRFILWSFGNFVIFGIL